MEEIQRPGVPEDLELGRKLLVCLPKAELHRKEIEDRQDIGYVSPFSRSSSPAAAEQAQTQAT